MIGGGLIEGYVGGQGYGLASREFVSNESGEVLSRMTVSKVALRFQD